MNACLYIHFVSNNKINWGKKIKDLIMVYQDIKYSYSFKTKLFDNFFMLFPRKWFLILMRKLWKNYIWGEINRYRYKVFCGRVRDGKALYKE